MALIDISGVTRGVSKLTSGIFMVVEPVGNLLEMASESSNAWALSHAADLAAKTERKNVTRESFNADLLRRALASAAQAKIDTNAYERDVQTAVAIDGFKGKIHHVQLTAICTIDETIIAGLAAKDNVSDADIRRAVKVGSMATVVSEDEESSTAFDLSKYQTA